MRCPNCGADVVGDSPFCPNCGADLTSKVRSRRRFLRNVDRGVRHGAAAAITFMAVVSVLAVVLSAFPAPAVEPPGLDDTFSPPDDALMLNDGYVVLGGAFSEGTMSARVDGEGYLDITLSDSMKDGCHTFLWDFRDVASAESYMLTKTEQQYPGAASTLEWIEPDYGEWTVTVTCVSDEGETVVRGTISYYGDLEETAVWEHGGRTLRVTYGVSLGEYASALAADVPREEDSMSAALECVDAGAVSGLESLIWEAYSSTFTFDRSSTDYACCILSLVSSCIDTRDDLTAFGVSVHWSTPVETLYNGYGDTGDKAVLAASLLAAAGFDVALADLPGTWAVAVSGCMVGSDVPSGYAVLGIPVGGVLYHVCSVDGFMGIGIMPDLYGYDGGITYCGEAVGGRYGLTPCTTN